jgi:hypothetical protein
MYVHLNAYYRYMGCTHVLYSVQLQYMTARGQARRLNDRWWRRA